MSEKMTTPTPEDGCKAEKISADQREIRRLRHEVEGLTRAGVVECMVRNPAVFERISELERDLAAAQERIAAQTRIIGVLTLDLAAAQEARQAAKALAESYRKDAERYRLVRSGMSSGFVVTMNIGHDWIEQIADELDSAIDAAKESHD